MRPNKHADSLARTAQALRAAGLSYLQIAARLGLANGKSSVQGLLKRKLPPPPPWTEPPPFIIASRLPPINRGCQWAFNDHAPWEWCGAKVDRGQVWCEEHRAMVYHQPRKLEDA